jgi:signal peptidase I
VAVTDATGVAVAPTERRRSGLRRLADATIVLALATVVTALGSALAPRLLGYEALAITSGSMGGAAPVGSLALIRDRLASEVRVGDVIALERPGSPIVVHRVLALENVEGTPSARTKGDANPSPDPEPYPLTGEVPVMARAIPFVGYLVALLQVPLGWLLLIALPATAVAAATLRDLWRSEDGERVSTAPGVDGNDLEPALAATRAELAALREHAVRALVELKRRLEAAESETTSLRAAVAAVPAEPAAPEVAAELERLLAESRAEAASLRERLVGVEQRVGEAVPPGPRLEGLERLLREARAEIVTLRESFAAASAEAAVAALERRAIAAESEAAALRAQLAAAAAAPPPAPARLPLRPAAPVTAAADRAEPFILFVPNASGYRLVERRGELPAAGERVDVDGAGYVVARVAPSPLPGDGRRCAYVAPTEA